MAEAGSNLGALTEEQQCVVTHVDGPAVVVACPGSGKTRTLTQRGVAPSAILGITFTRAAADEMKTRLAQLIPPDRARPVRLYTFHGLAWRIITEIQSRPNVLDDRGQRAMARQILREFRLNANRTAIEGLLTDFAFFVGAQIPADRFPPSSYDDRYIDQYCEWSGSDPREAREVLSALEQIPEAQEDARAYLALAARAAQQDADTEEAPGRITLSSLHGAKGLEWERVWLLSAVEGALPHRYSIDSGSQAPMEEERRLFYVGMTRAKDMLMVSAPAHMFGQDARVSRFVQESGIWAPPPPTVLKTVGRRGAAAPAPAAPLPPPLPAEDYAPGVICFHAKFGNGVIDRVAKQAGLVEVLFGGQRKVLDLEVCQAGQVLRVGSRY